MPMHLQECFAYLGLPSPARSRRASALPRETLALPIQPELTEDRLRYVVDCVRDFFVAKATPADVEHLKEMQAVPVV